MGRDFPPVQTGPGTHPASCTMGTGSFLGIKYGLGVLLTTHPLLVSQSWKSRAIPAPTLGPCNGNALPFYSGIYDYHLLIYNIAEDVVGLYIKSILIACKIFKQSHKFRNQGMAHTLCIFMAYSTTHKIPLIVYCQMVGWLMNSKLERM